MPEHSTLYVRAMHGTVTDIGKFVVPEMLMGWLATIPQ